MKRTVLLVLAFSLAGCNGGTVDRQALTNDASTIDSINCEAWLLSRAVSRNRVTVYYAREQAEELALQAANFADALGHRATAPGLEQRVRAKARDAAALTSRLRRLHDRPADRERARTLAATFRRAGNCS